MTIASNRSTKTNLSVRFLIAVSLGFSSFCHSDILWLKNGDQISGTLLYLESNEVAFTSYAAERISVPWGKVSTLSTASVVKISFKDERPAIKGQLSRSDEGQVKVKESGVIIKLDEILSLLHYRPLTLAWNWDGNLNLSLEFKDSQTDNEDKTKAKAKVKTNIFDDLWRNTITGDFENNRDNETVEDNNYTAEYALDYFFSRPWFWRGRARNERDYVNNNLRVNEYATGPGYQLWDNEVGSFNIALEYIHARYSLVFDEAGEQIPLHFTTNSGGLSWDFKRNVPSLKSEIYTFGKIYHPDEMDVQHVLDSESGIRHHLTNLITLSIILEYDQTKGDSYNIVDQRLLFGIGVAW